MQLWILRSVTDRLRIKTQQLRPAFSYCLCLLQQSVEFRCSHRCTHVIGLLHWILCPLVMTLRLTLTYHKFFFLENRCHRACPHSTTTFFSGVLYESSQLYNFLRNAAVGWGLREEQASSMPFGSCTGGCWFPLSSFSCPSRRCFYSPAEESLACLREYSQHLSATYMRLGCIVLETACIVVILSVENNVVPQRLKISLCVFLSQRRSGTRPRRVLHSALSKKVKPTSKPWQFCPQ